MLQVAYQLSWLLLLMYGLPSWFDSYKSVDRCAFFSNGTLNGLAGVWASPSFHCCNARPQAHCPLPTATCAAARC